MDKPQLNNEDNMIWIHRTKIKHSNWLKLKQIADAQGITREYLLNAIIETYVKHIKLEVSRR